MPEAPYLSIVIPCWNEQKNLESGVLDEVHRYLACQAFSWEVIVVDDGSTDASRSLVEAAIRESENTSLLDVPHGGKPAAVWAGIQQARGELVLATDMDQSTPIAELDKLLPWYVKGFDVVVGSRGLARAGDSPLRKVGSFAFAILCRALRLTRVDDALCGFKSWRRRAALEVFPHLRYFRKSRKPAGWRVSAYDVELLYLFDNAGYRIVEVLVDWQNRDRSDTKRRWGAYLGEALAMTIEVIGLRFRSRGIRAGLPR
jgi:glycosyltransferase involved in cell wall biosynthesis